MGGFRASADADLWFAVTGAWGRILLAGREVDPYEAHLWRAGDELHLDWFGHGARALPGRPRRIRRAEPCWTRGRPTCWPGSARGRCVPATS